MVSGPRFDHNADLVNYKDQDIYTEKKKDPYGWFLMSETNKLL